MPLLTRTTQQLIDEAKARLRTQTQITNTDRGSTSGMLIEIAAGEHAALYDQIQRVYRDAFLSTASGDALDRIGVLLATPRVGSLRAFDDSQNVRFFIDPSTGETAQQFVLNRLSSAAIDDHPDTLSNTGFTIREGVTLTAQTGATYTTATSTSLTGTATDGFIAVVATGIGSTFNVPMGSLNAHNLATFQPELSPLADFILVENRMPITNGTFTEGDDNYRVRLQQAFLRLQSANSTAIITAALSVPGIRNAVLIPYAGGLHAFELLVEGVDPVVSNGLLAAAQAAVNTEVAAGNKGRVRRPLYKAIEAKAALRYRPRADRIQIRQRARRVAVDYINGLPLGQEFVLNELIQRVLDVSDLILDVQFQRFAVGTFNPTAHTIENSTEQVPSNVLSQSVFEKWLTSDRLFTVCDQ